MICPGCKQEIPKEDIEVYKGEEMCPGCAENADMFENSDDPTGRNWEVA